MKAVLRYLACRRHNTIDAIAIAMASICFSRGDYVLWIAVIAAFAPLSALVEKLAKDRSA